MKTFKELLIETLKTQEQINLFNQVVSARDVEVKIVPKQGTETMLKIRAKSVSPKYVFIVRAIDITMTNISQSINVDF